MTKYYYFVHVYVSYQFTHHTYKSVHFHTILGLFQYWKNLRSTKIRKPDWNTTASDEHEILQAKM